MLAVEMAKAKEKGVESLLAQLQKTDISLGSEAFVNMLGDSLPNRLLGEPM